MLDCLNLLLAALAVDTTSTGEPRKPSQFSADRVLTRHTLIRSYSYLGAQYRRLRTKLGAPKAITAMAHRLARLVYRILKYGQGYIDKGTEYYEHRYRQQQLQFLQQKAAQLGLRIMEAQA